MPGMGLFEEHEDGSITFADGSQMTAEAREYHIESFGTEPWDEQGYFHDPDAEEECFECLTTTQDGSTDIVHAVVHEVGDDIAGDVAEVIQKYGKYAVYAVGAFLGFQVLKLVLRRG